MRHLCYYSAYIAQVNPAVAQEGTGILENTEGLVQDSGFS